MRLPTTLLAAAILLQACASYDGRGLVPGQSTAAEVERTMGPATEKQPGANGEEVWFYPRNPAGRHTYAIRIAPGGALVAIEQRLTEQNLRRLVADTTTARDVRRLFGPPNLVTHQDRQAREVWEYRMFNAIQIPYNLYVQFSPDGVVREVLFLRDPSQDFPGNRR